MAYSLKIKNTYGIDLYATFECGQCFRFNKIENSEYKAEYRGVAHGKHLEIADDGEFLHLNASDEEFNSVWLDFLGLSEDYSAIHDELISLTDNKALHSAIKQGGGIRILKQDPWETLFSFIISQNNNIPRIRKMIRRLSAEYGVNICLQNGASKCPLGKISTTPCDEKCKECGCCYTFPTATAVYENPEKMKPANPGFRYKYLYDAARRIALGETNLEMIAAARSYEYTKSKLCEIHGVGEKVASCTALFGFANFEAFPIDVWMRRAIDEYFDGVLDPASLGRYAGVAQQYIFHYIRNLKE